MKDRTTFFWSNRSKQDKDDKYAKEQQASIESSLEDPHEAQDGPVNCGCPHQGEDAGGPSMGVYDESFNKWNPFQIFDEGDEHQPVPNEAQEPGAPSEEGLDLSVLLPQIFQDFFPSLRTDLNFIDDIFLGFYEQVLNQVAANQSLIASCFIICIIVFIFQLLWIPLSECDFIILSFYRLGHDGNLVAFDI